MSEIGQRLSHFLDNEGISQPQVARDMKVSLQYVNGMRKGRNTIGKKNAAKLQELYGINAGWLLTGEGKMYADRPGSGVLIAHDDGPATAPDASPSGISLSAGSVNGGTTAAPMRNYAKGRPYYNVDFTLGFDFMVNDQTQNPDYLIDFPPYNDCDCWCNAHGDSMHPTISSGDIVALKRIEDFRYLINGEIYALVTSNGLRTIKRIRDNGDTFTLIPDNPSVGQQDIPKSLITHAFLVRGTFKMF